MLKKTAWYKFQKRKNDKYNHDTNKKVYDQTQQFCNFLKNNIKNYQKLNYLDCACGNGYQTFFIKKKLKLNNVSAFDFNHLYIDEAKKKYPEISWFKSNINNNFIKKGKYYEVIYSLQTLSILDDGYENYFKVIKKNKPIFFSGSILLYDGDANFKTLIEMKNEKFVYHFYNKQKFIFDLKKLFFNKIIIKKFKINIDIPKRNNNSLGTYTLKVKNDRMMISGPFIMNWYFFIAY